VSELRAVALQSGQSVDADGQPSSAGRWNNVMKENTKNQVEGVHLPPVWCGAICRNAMNEICVERCAPKRDCSGFDEKPNLKLTDMPRFPKTEGMTREEKFTSVTVYLAKVVDHLQGAENDHETNFVRRPHIDRSRSGALSETVKVEDILSGFAKADSPLEAGKKREDQGI
jgi:hypothetical protein